MINQVREAYDIADKAYPPLEKWLGTERATKLHDLVQERLDNGRPIIMVYGIYNAGKSTLLNALAGEEKATVSNRPETSEVTPYRWRDFELLDTPGIDAPQDHEAISREQLEVADAVIFVLDSISTFEETRVYEELVDIMAMGKRTIMVINNKTGLTHEQPEIHRIYDKVLQNVETFCRERDIEESLWREVPFLLVNAREALKGKIEGKQPLVDDSGIENLEHKLDQVLAETGLRDVINTVGTRLVAEIKNALEEADRTDDSEARRVEEQGVALTTTRAAATNTIAKEMNRCAHHIANGIVDAHGKGEMAVRALLDHAGARLANVHEVQFIEAKRLLAGHDLPLELPGPLNMSPNADGIVDEAESRESNDGGSRFSDTAKSTIGGIAGQPQVVSRVTETAAKQGLELVKRSAPELMKGIGPVTMAKWAATSARTVSTALVVLPIIIDLYRAKAEDDAARREAKRKEDWASETAEHWLLECKRGSAELVDRTFHSAKTELRRRKDSLAEVEHSRIADLQCLLELKDRAEGLLLS